MFPISPSFSFGTFLSKIVHSNLLLKMWCLLILNDVFIFAICNFCLFSLFLAHVCYELVIFLVPLKNKFSSINFMYSIFLINKVL